MAWTPISLIVPQYVDASGAPYSGAVLKAYAAGTTTNIVMATDSGGGTTFTSIALNASGFPSHSGSIVIPHVAQSYKLVLYPTQAAADANTGAIWTVDNLMQIIISGSFSIDDAVSSGVTQVITATHSTSGTPVAGIGASIGLVVETSSGNNETGMTMEALTTDVTPTAESFDWVLKLMRAGAAVATKLRVSSLGRVFGFTSLDLARATVASHATTGDIWSVGNQIDWTGTATTTAFPAAPQAGSERVLICAGACTFTAGANMLIDGLASGASITCVANDEIMVRAISTTQFKLTRRPYTAVDLPKGADIASASTTNLQTATGNLVHITGTTTITAVTLTRGPRTVLFDGILTLTHHATNNNLPGATNITTAAGDRAIYWSDGTTVYCINYQRADGSAVQTAGGNNIVEVHTGNGHGSGSTCIRRFTTAITNTGAAITYADDSTLGGTFTINEAGIYAITYVDGDATTGGHPIGISVNSAALTTAVDSIAVATRKAMATTQTVTNGARALCACTLKLAVADIVRAHTDGSVDGANDTVQFSIRKIGT